MITPTDDLAAELLRRAIATKDEYERAELIEVAVAVHLASRTCEPDPWTRASPPLALA
jgi:hypothetical protein